MSLRAAQRSLRLLGALALAALATACASINQKLISASRRGNAARAARLLAAGAAPTEHDKHGYTALVWAAYRGDTPLLKLLLNHRADVNDRSAAPPYRDALSIAILQGRDDAAELLIARGAEVNARDAAGNGPLGAAAAKGDARIARALLGGGAAVDAPSPYSPHRTALLAAAAAGSLEVARALLDKGANPNAWDDASTTALHLAAERGDAELARLLLARGARRLAKDGDGRTPADVAKKRKHPELAALLDPGAAR